jgi:hypothetical protein
VGQVFDLLPVKVGLLGQVMGLLQRFRLPARRQAVMQKTGG